MTKKIKEKDVVKKFYPIDLEGAVKDGWKATDAKLEVKKVIAQVNGNLKKYLPKGK